MGNQRTLLSPSRRSLATKIRGEAELRQLIDTLSVDLGRIHDRLWLFHALMRARKRRYTLALSQSQTFWSLVYGGLHDSALSGLCRAYDQTNHDDMLTLRSLLETLKARPAFLPGSASQIDPRQLQKDLDSVSKEKSRQVDHLSKWRNKFFAHRDARKILNGNTLGVDAPLTFRDVDTLLKRAFRILNRYNLILFRNSHAMQAGLVGYADYEKVLQTLQKAAKARQLKLTGR